ncbi:MAG: SIMPL domain-containing protein [Devosiaceae bacterium]|nr:SIMPL domain-containing protein [Devosiaceae bacterium MH13]
MLLLSSRRVVGIALLAFALTVSAAAKSALAQEGAATPEPLREATITITGRAEVTAEPDIAVISAGAITEARTARAALDANSKIMNDTFAALEALGVERRDMQTRQLSVNPRYTHFEPVNGERRPPRIDGYTVSNSLVVRIRDLATVGEALDALISAGVNQMGGLSFAVDEPEALLMEARQAAVADALAQAELLATGAGVELGRVISISQGGQRQVAFEPQMARMAMADAAEAVPIASGEQTLSAQVTIVWALDNGSN